MFVFPEEEHMGEYLDAMTLESVVNFHALIGRDLIPHCLRQVLSGNFPCVGSNAIVGL